MKIGYAWWGFMADIRTKNGELYSSPDGSYCHSFSIIRGFQEAGHEVYRMYPDRDQFYVNNAERPFEFFSEKNRLEAYNSIKACNHKITKEEIKCFWPEVDAIILEWRMETSLNTKKNDDDDFEADLILQNLLIEHYTKKGTPIICLDLDYKMTSEDDKKFSFVYELGFKRGFDHHIEIPFIFDDILQFRMRPPIKQIVYVGNRYERDEAFETFFGKKDEVFNYVVYGNWKERNRDSKERWPHIIFRDRLHPKGIAKAYSQAVSVPLLAKNEYSENGFMTARLIETLLFGTIPLLPRQFKSPLNYIPEELRIQDGEEMGKVSRTLFSKSKREKLRLEIVKNISFMDVKFFVQKIMKKVKEAK